MQLISRSRTSGISIKSSRQTRKHPRATKSRIISTPSSRVTKRHRRSRSCSSSSTPTSAVTTTTIITSSSSSSPRSPTTFHPENTQNTPTMSKLSEGLKALISAAHARPGYTRAPSNIKSVFSQLAQDAKSRHVGMPAWVTISTAASMTLNCPEAMTQLFNLTRELDSSSSSSQSQSPAQAAAVTAELMREVGLKCISFNGIPRAINCLGAFYNDLPADVKSHLSTHPSREYTSSNVESRLADGYALWDSVYFGVERKLLNKLAQSHPDLPVHIIHSHYANVLSDPPTTRVPGAKVGRVLTSLIAIACLRSQTGVGPQVTSHVFGLRKAYERGDAHAKGEEEVEGGEWLASEDGNRWILETIDGIVGAIAGGDGTTFAPGMRPKL